jgi:ribosome production factor 2
MSTIEKSSTTPVTTLSSLKAMTKKKEKELDPIERFKRILFLKGRHSSEILNDVMKDLTLLSKPHNKALTKKNDIVPFEDVNSLEFLGSKNDCGLFVLASHSKKRPNNLVIVSSISFC